MASIQIGKGKRITGVTREKLMKKVEREYKSGSSIRSIAEQLDRSYGFVHCLLSESGVTIRPRGGHRSKEGPSSET